MQVDIRYFVKFSLLQVLCNFKLEKKNESRLYLKTHLFGYGLYRKYLKTSVSLAERSNSKVTC